MNTFSHSLEAIGFVVSPYKQKFGIARQPGLVPASKIVLQLLPQYSADCVRGLEGFSHVWLQFVFHGVVDEGWAPLVRPPRLGGKQKMGVFATRSPHRPNHLGLSLLKLEGVESGKNVCLHLSGADLLDGTPVVDIKPYIPFVEAKTDALSHYIDGPPPLLQVSWSPKAQASAKAYGLDADFLLLAEQSIAQDPRPAYQDLPQRVYVMQLADMDIAFQITEGEALIVDIDKSAS
ncbi:tRNA-Thr(GGU) m(6)t(6)A37 methyltransferase TsaA [Neisseria sp. HSC-16F19]|nr:tRNA (N6-threonylcarbamoyladenosine(37)-N6)-methyltransferase TrmO [Neisseria sp. HSC-16F19]MCP2039963.1 tRNA-Thr(GGU) m(6)t(6)A37 methyltransferase TsaA [Neisseria sp. HSC-16F19]